MLISGDFQVTSLVVVGDGVSVGFKPVRWNRLNQLWATDPRFSPPDYDGQADGELRFTVLNPEVIAKLTIGGVHRFGLGFELKAD